MYSISTKRLKEYVYIIYNKRGIEQSLDFIDFLDQLNVINSLSERQELKDFIIQFDETQPKKRRKKI